MYYLKCKHCNHLNEVKSEYLVVCGLCNRKLVDNYKDWKVKHPEKSFEDFQREVCLTEEQVKKGDTIKPTGKRGNKKGLIAGGIGGILVMLMILLLIKGMKDSYDELYGDGDTPVLEQQWYAGTYAGGASLATPKAMKSVGNVMNKLPEEVRPLVKEMQTFSYKGNGLEFMYLYTEYTPEVGQVDLEGAVNGGLNQLKNQPGVFDLKNDIAYVEEGGLSGVVMQGTYVQRGTEYEFKITLYTTGLKLYQFISSNKKGDDTARGVVRRIYDSLNQRTWNIRNRRCRMKEQVYLLEQFDDIKILRYDVPAFEGLSLREKLFVYYLSRAALAGRDILWDQNNKYNLRVRAALESILRAYQGNRETKEFQAFLVYAKKVFFANGVHHHYSMEKFTPSFTPEYFKSLLREVGAQQLYEEVERVIFDPEYMAKRVVLDEGKDLVQASANHYYEGVTQEEVEKFYGEKKKENALLSWGLNSTLVRDENGQLKEQVWFAGGKYGKEIHRIVEYLKKAAEYACNAHQKEVIELLIRYYEMGDLSLFDRYSIEWVK